MVFIIGATPENSPVASKTVTRGLFGGSTLPPLVPGQSIAIMTSLCMRAPPISRSFTLRWFSSLFFTFTKREQATVTITRPNPDPVQRMTESASPDILECGFWAGQFIKDFLVCVTLTQGGGILDSVTGKLSLSDLGLARGRAWPGMCLLGAGEVDCLFWPSLEFCVRVDTLTGQGELQGS